MKLYNENDISSLVRQVKHDSDDLSVVNAARVSFANEHKELVFTDDKDPRLIRYLAKHRHFTPFTHQWFRFKGIDLSMEDIGFLIDRQIPIKRNSNSFSDWSISLFGLVDLFVDRWGFFPPLALMDGLSISINALINAKGINPNSLKSYDCYHRGFGVQADRNFKTIYHKMPIFTARQWVKHISCFCRSEINEGSRRYIRDSPEFYSPLVWRAKPEGSIKQGSSKEAVDENKQIRHDYNNVIHKSAMMYECLLMGDVCPEQARMSLSQSMMVEFWETARDDDRERLIKLRVADNAQLETRLYAERVREIMKENVIAKDRVLTDQNV